MQKRFILLENGKHVARLLNVKDTETVTSPSVGSGSTFKMLSPLSDGFHHYVWTFVANMGTNWHSGIITSTTNGTTSPVKKQIYSETYEPIYLNIGIDVIINGGNIELILTNNELSGNIFQIERNVAL